MVSGRGYVGGIELTAEIDSTNPSVIQFDFNAQDSTLPDMNYLYAFRQGEPGENPKGIVLILPYAVVKDSIHDLDCFTAVQTRKLGNFNFGKNPDCK